MSVSVVFAQQEVTQASNELNRTKSMKNIRALFVALAMYEADNNKLPLNIADLKPYANNLDEIKKCAVTGKEIEYIRAVDKIVDANAPSKVVIFKSVLEDGVIYGYLDGHVQFIKEKFEKQRE